MSLSDSFERTPEPADIDRERCALVAALGRVGPDDRAVLVGVIRRVAQIQASHGDAVAEAALEQVRTMLDTGARSRPN